MNPKNGEIVTVEQVDEEFQYVYQTRDDDREDLEAWADLLRILTEQHGPPDQGRHAAHRLYIQVAPGDKHSGYVAEVPEIEHNGADCAKTSADIDKCRHFDTPGPSL